MLRNEAEYQKRALRHPVRLDAYARREGEEVFRVLITQMAYGGCQILCTEKFTVGDRLILSLPRMGEITGQVRWTAGDKSGFAFDFAERSADQRSSSIAHARLRKLTT